MGFSGASGLVREKHESSPGVCGISAVFIREVSAPDEDGERWRFGVTDGIKGGEVDVVLSDSARLIRVTPDQLVAALERRAGSWPVEARLECLVAASPVGLFESDL